MNQPTIELPETIAYNIRYSILKELHRVGERKANLEAWYKKQIHKTPKNLSKRKRKQYQMDIMAGYGEDILNLLKSQAQVEEMNLPYNN